MMGRRGRDRIDIASRCTGIVAAFALVACRGGDEVPRHVPEEVFSAVGETMGTTYQIRVVGADADAFEQAVRRVDELLVEVNQRFSTYVPDSMISRLNADRGGGPFPVDEEFVAVLDVALRIADASSGSYDPTVLPLVRALDFGPGSDDEPATEAELAAARALVDYRKIRIVDGPALVKLEPRAEIDLSSIAKGAGVDRVSELLTSIGFPRHMVEIGGEVRCHGLKPNGSAWQIGVERPDGDRSARAVTEVVGVRDRAIATSGSYRNFRDSGDQRLHHVLDARTGVNAPNGVVSVSVDAPSCTLADGLATALMVVGPEQAERVLAPFRGRDLGVLFLLAGPDGEVSEVRLGWPAPR